MSNKLITIVTVALTCSITPAFAQGRAPARATPGVQITQRARSNPGVQVLRSVASFDTTRTNLKQSAGTALSEVRSTKAAKGKAQRSKLDALATRIADVSTHATSTLAQLPGGAKSGKTKAAHTLATRIERHATSARAHQRAARSAMVKGNTRTLRRELDAVEADLRAIDELSTKLGLIEPIVKR